MDFESGKPPGFLPAFDQFYLGVLGMGNGFSQLTRTFLVVKEKKFKLAT